MQNGTVHCIFLETGYFWHPAPLHIVWGQKFNFGEILLFNVDAAN